MPALSASVAASYLPRLVALEGERGMREKSTLILLLGYAAIGVFAVLGLVDAAPWPMNLAVAVGVVLLAYLASCKLLPLESEPLPDPDVDWLKQALMQSEYCPICGQPIEPSGACACCHTWASRLNTLYFSVRPDRKEILASVISGLLPAGHDESTD
jgi:hypothetical protein